jgi:tripartite-type tricarboxylate transporter receptor subunit TctC
MRERRKKTRKEVSREAFMRILGALAGGLSLLLTPAMATAQDFPNKAIRLIVPFPAGGPNDIIARVVGQRMSELTKQPVVIDNRGGQGGVLGTDAVAKASPDGYTIGIVSAGSLAISPSMEKVAYDALKDLAPVTLVATVPEMLVVTANLPAKNMKELIELAKAQPGKLNFASTGPGSLTHLAGELFKLKARIDIVHVPYRGAAPAVADLLGQQVQMAFLDLPILLPQVKVGTLRAIAIGAPQRAPTAMEVPTTAEVGAGDDAAGHHRSAEPDRDGGDARSRGEGKTRGAGRRTGRRQSGTFSQFYRRRNREMGEGDQGRRRRDDEMMTK